jgi:hypothetical protein
MTETEGGDESISGHDLKMPPLQVEIIVSRIQM